MLVARLQCLLDFNDRRALASHSLSVERLTYASLAAGAVMVTEAIEQAFVSGRAVAPAIAMKLREQRSVAACCSISFASGTRK
jgi:hypothetical protein